MSGCHQRTATPRPGGNRADREGHGGELQPEPQPGVRRDLCRRELVPAQAYARDLDADGDLEKETGDDEQPAHKLPKDRHGEEA
ncbi:MAG TPA: hypothetical protein VE287_04705 [Actinopolymorphaceae bacterium]|jgi:hypothetical protein|nr:hypothetical protein [Actinopolymorphaceae bacterium]